VLSGATVSNALEIAGDARDVEEVVGESHELLNLPLGDRQRSLAQRRVSARSPKQLEGVANRRQRISQFVRQGRQKLVLPPIGFAKHVLGILARRHIDAHTDATADVAVAVVQRLDVVLHVGDGSVRPDDLDVVGDVGPVCDRVLHRQLLVRQIPPVTLNAIQRTLARGRCQRNIDAARKMKQSRERIVCGDEPAVGVVRDGNRNRRARDQIGERAKPHA
jgi:hypothetical protein